MKKGKKLPAIEIEGHSEKRYALMDGKIVPVAPDHDRMPSPGELNNN